MYQFENKLFSDDDREHLKNELEAKLNSDFVEEKANNFINNLEAHCFQMKRLMDLPANSLQFAELKAIVNNFQKCIGHLNDLPIKYGYFWWAGLSRNFYDVDFGPDLGL